MDQGGNTAAQTVAFQNATFPCLWEELSKSNWSKFNSAGVRIFPNQRRTAASLGRFIEAGDTSADAKQAAAGRLMRRLENLTFIDIS